MKTEKRYISRGHVYGALWGGGEGAYPARTLHAATKEDLMNKASKGLDGSLDSGMGFESLIGARLDIEEIESVMIGPKIFERSEYRRVYIGDLTARQKNFLSHLEL